MPKVVVHVTEDFLLDVAALYKETGDAAEDVRDSILNAFRLLKTGEWDDGLISPCGLLGTNFPISSAATTHSPFGSKRTVTTGSDQSSSTTS